MARMGNDCLSFYGVPLVECFPQEQCLHVLHRTRRYLGLRRVLVGQKSRDFQIRCGRESRSRRTPSCGRRKEASFSQNTNPRKGVIKMTRPTLTTVRRGVSRRKGKRVSPY